MADDGARVPVARREVWGGRSLAEVFRHDVAKDPSPLADAGSGSAAHRGGETGVAHEPAPVARAGRPS